MKKVIKGKEVLRRVIKQGDSLMVTIPPEIRDSLRIRAGDQIVITSDDECVTYRKYRGVVDDNNV
jgi:AbrB family looped-hinge helix DNA binding protein